MHHFAYKGGTLYCEDVALNDISDAVGTPVYVYSTATLRRHARVIAAAFDKVDCLIAYSVKANGNLAVLATLASEGCGADVVSAGEMKRALSAGIPANKIVFSGVGKTAEEMAAALEAGIYQFNVESEAELYMLGRVATRLSKTAPIAFRVNPDVAAGGHPNISTGKQGDKFGVPWSEARAVYAKAMEMANIHPVGIDVHIGSQIGDLGPMEAAFRRTTELTRQLVDDGVPIERIDLGGGLGIPYKPDDAPAPPADYAAMVARVVSELPRHVQVILEPGRVIAGNAGVLVTEALYEKTAPDRTFLIIDAGMNDLMRPALYSAHHEIWPLREPAATDSLQDVDVVGPICESTDKFATARSLPKIENGERLAILSAGAYGAVLSSQYNARPLVPEVLVDGASYAIIRRRPSFEDMISLEQLPPWLIP